MNVEASWALYRRHYDDLDALERKRLRQWIAYREIQMKETAPAIQVLIAAMQFLGVS